MAYKKKEKAQGSDLRKKAEETLAAGTDLKDLSDRDARELLHELQIHQVELQMQNEELRRVQAEIEESRTRYADLYDFAPIGYLTLDRQGVVVEANLTACRQLQAERRTFEGRPFFLYVQPQGRQKLRMHTANVIDREQRQVSEIELKRKDGSTLEARLDSVAAVNNSGRKVCRTSIVDITEQKRAENEIRRLNQELHEHTFRLEAANRELESFSYSAAHDLSTPLRTIDGFAKALADDYCSELDDTAKDYINRVRAAAQRMANVIDAILALSGLARREITLPVWI